LNDPVNSVSKYCNCNYQGNGKNDLFEHINFFKLNLSGLLQLAPGIIYV
jgi:hypothetical protein